MAGDLFGGQEPSVRRGRKKVADANPVDEVYQDLPEFVNENQMRGVKRLTVLLATDEDRETFAALVGQNIHRTTKTIWFPVRKKCEMREFYVEDGAGEP